jgi:hypothetical protein
VNKGKGKKVTGSARKDEIPDDLIWWLSGHVDGFNKGLAALTKLMELHGMKSVVVNLIEASYSLNRASNLIREYASAKPSKPSKSKAGNPVGDKGDNRG